MIEEVIRKILGRRLTGAAGTFHVYKGHVSATPLSVWLGFDGASRYRFGGASNGWHLIVDEASPEEIDMQGSGSVRLRDMGVEQPISGILNQCVRRAWLVSSPGPADIIGVRFDFETATVRILNWGDEMYIAEELPTDTEPNGICEWPIQ